MAATAMNTADATAAARIPAITALRWGGSCHYGVGAALVLPWCPMPGTPCCHPVVAGINCCLGIGYS